MAGTLARARCERQGDEKTGILVGDRAVLAAAVEEFEPRYRTGSMQ